MFSAIYRISLEKEPRRVVLKVGTVPGMPLLTYEQDVMPTEAACYQMLKQHTTVPVPSILASDFSKRHCRSNYFFMSELEGVPLSRVSRNMSRENLAEIRLDLAGHLAQVHGINGSYYGYFTDQQEYRFGTWREAFQHMFRQLLGDALERGIRLPYERIAAALEQHAVCLEILQKPSLVIFDCHEGNVFVKKNRDRFYIEGIIDFERAFWGDPAADFPAAFVGLDSIEKEEEFYLKSVGDPGAWTKEDAIRFQLYRLYLAVVMAAEVFRYGRLYAAMQGTWAKRCVSSALNALEQ